MVNKVKRMFLGLIILTFLGSGLVYAGDYTDSAHGNTTYGVKRTATGFPTDYTKGNCAHCHEQHASIAGDEPLPDTPAGPDEYLLFSDNHVDQTTNFCFDCHCGPTGGYQTGGLVNRSYSYRAGGWTSDTLDDILQAFTYGPPTSTTSSSHKLDDISTFITGKWGYTANSNPCAACHNPHVAQGDPANLPNSAKTTSTTRGWPVTLPSKHGSLVAGEISWGDGAGEKMSGYTYQAPYRFGSTTEYEPDGSTTTYDGSNLTDYVTFCQDCHTTGMNASPYAFGLPNTPIDWTTTGGESGGDKHGKNVATVGVNLDAPYAAAWDSTNGLVLACTDCHEPHGAPNVMLIRKEVNGAALDSITTITSTDCTAPYLDHNKELGYLCNRCHEDDLDHYGGVAANRWYWVHHASSDKPYTPSSCKNCHSGGDSSGYTSNRSPINCNCCHYHGSSAASRVTF